jgi:hypothetical protein
MTALQAHDPPALLGDDAGVVVVADPARRFRERRRHWEMLSLSVIALVLSVVLRLTPDGHAAVPGLMSHPIPESCPSQRVFGVRCPGCGLTRSFISLAHGHWHESLGYHRLGWLIFLATVAQVPYRLLRIYTPPALPAGVRFRWFGWMLIGLLIGNWGLEMAGRWLG